MIDVHHHFLPIELVEDLEHHVPPHVSVQREGSEVVLRRRSDGLLYLRLDPAVWCDPERQLRDMDEAGVEHAVLSVACYQDWMTSEAARACNDGISAVVQQFPDRFSGMVSAPPDGGDEAARELQRGRDELGLCAANLTTNFSGRYPDHASFRPFFEAAAELELAVFLHPSWHPPSTENLDEWGLERTLGKGADLCLAIARLVYAGVLTELPALHLAVAHLGGVLPMTARRMFDGPPGWLPTPAFDYRELLSRVWVDTAPGIWQSPTEIGFAATALGESQILFGTDYPLSNDPVGIMTRSVDHLNRLDVSDAAHESIASENARRCFRLAVV